MHILRVVSESQDLMSAARSDDGCHARDQPALPPHPRVPRC